MEKYIEQNLQQLSIYELRAIARQVGVKSPTTKKHNELIDSILKIQNGEEQAFLTNKGRPPKAINFVNQPVDPIQEEGVPMEYGYADETTGYLLCDDKYIDGIYPTYTCQGIVREVNGKKYVYDYISSKRIANIEEGRLFGINLKKGDFVTGQAFAINPNNGVLNSVSDINFANVPSFDGEKTQRFNIHMLEKNNDVYSQVINNDKNQIKIVLELEADNFGIITMRNKCVYFYSAEFEDIKRSYNAVLDCLKLVQNLSQTNKPFSLYIIDLDYVYTILNAYLTNVEARTELDACQFLKELFIAVKNDVGAELNIFQKTNYKRSSYLDAIINKYLS